MFAETAGRARILTTLLDVRRPVGGDNDAWRITGAQGLTTVEGLYRLRLNSSMRFAARGLTISAIDLLITLEEGHVYLVESDAGTTGLVLFGRGVMRFSPGPVGEQGQLRIFAGASRPQCTIRRGLRASSSFPVRTARQHRAPDPGTARRPAVATRARGVRPR